MWITAHIKNFNGVYEVYCIHERAAVFLLTWSLSGASLIRQKRLIDPANLHAKETMLPFYDRMWPTEPHSKTSFHTLGSRIYK